MAYDKKTENLAYKKLISDIKNGSLGSLYVFFGAESYLKNHYLGQIKKQICGESDDFNYEFLEGEKLDINDLEAAVETFPFGSEKKLIVVRDYNLLHPGDAPKERLTAMFQNLPPHLCLIFYFDVLEFKPDKRLNFYKLIEKTGSLVEFELASSADLTAWIKRHFAAHKKQIDTALCQHLMFLCGFSMTNLKTEIDKIAFGAKGEIITKELIDSLASRVLEANIFDITDAISNGNYKKTIEIMAGFADAKTEPIAILSVLTKQFFRLYGTRLALNAKKGERFVMEITGLTKSYPASLLMKSAQKMSLSFLRKAQSMCLECDILLKSNLGDKYRTLDMLLLNLANEAGA